MQDGIKATEPMDKLHASACDVMGQCMQYVHALACDMHALACDVTGRCMHLVSSLS